VKDIFTRAVHEAVVIMSN